LGYFEGGYSVLADSLKKEIVKNKGKIFLEKEVKLITKVDEKFEIKINEDSKPILFDNVIATVSPETFLKIFPGLSSEEKEQINKLESLGSLCLVLELEESLLSDGTYWLNINDQTFPFVAVVEHTNFIDKANYGNRPLVYIGGYYPKQHEFFKLEKEELIKKFTFYLNKINKNFNNKRIKKSWLFKDFYAQPIVNTNYSNNLPSIKTSTEGFYWTSLHHVYPYDRGVNYAIKLGKKTADEIIKKSKK
jgi:protoporphyrinogen oxidase